MTRKKVKLAFIVNDSARKATYKKRKRGFLKKMDELTTLCDVKACAILYSAYEAKPVVWPNPSGARDVISSFKRLPEMEKAKKMVSQEEFLRQRVAKAHEQLKRQQKDNREKEMGQVMYQCLTGKSTQNLSLLDLSDLRWVIDQHLYEINKRTEGLKKENIPNNDIPNKSSPPPPPTQVLGQNLTGSESANVGHNGDLEAMQMMMRPWPSFMDMMGPPIMHDHHHHHALNHNHHQIGTGMGGRGLGNGLSGENANASSSSGGGNNMSNMMMMMMGQFGEYHGHGVNPSMWSNNFFQ